MHPSSHVSAWEEFADIVTGLVRSCFHIPQLVAALAFLAVSPAIANAQEDRPPNILFLAIDDLRPSLGAYGDTFAVTPNIDALAARSLVFDRAYVPMATCSPSRAALMSGLRPDTTQIYYSRDTTKLVQDAIPAERTMNGFFKANGYESVGVGKIYHLYHDSEDGWSMPVLDHESDRSWKMRQKMVNPESYLEAVKWRDEAGKPWRPAPYEIANVDDAGHIDGANTLFAVQQMHRLAQTDKPFFFVVGIRKPHLPFNAPKKYWDLYDEAAVPMPTITAPPENASRYSVNNSGELRNYPWTPQAGEGFSDPFVRKMNHGYYAAISYADALVGKVLDTLKELDLEENTIIVLWGDHGYKVGDYGAFNKHTNLEIDTRVPLMISMPGDRESRRTSAIVETIDLFPTLAAMAGLTAPSDLEGENFEILLENPDQDFKDAALTQFYRGRDGKGIMGYAVRTKDFRYVSWFRTTDNLVLDTELYDLREDPFERLNIADDPAMAGILAEMEALRLNKRHGPM